MPSALECGVDGVSQPETGVPRKTCNPRFGLLPHYLSGPRQMKSKLKNLFALHLFHALSESQAQGVMSPLILKHEHPRVALISSLKCVSNIYLYVHSVRWLFPEDS